MEPMTHRLYVIVRGDLSETYRMVQGSHAVAQYALDHSIFFKQWNNEKIVFLKTFNGVELEKLANKLRRLCFNISVFKEPDMRSDLPTALVVYENGCGRTAEYLKHLSLA